MSVDDGGDDLRKFRVAYADGSRGLYGATNMYWMENEAMARSVLFSRPSVVDVAPVYGEVDTSSLSVGSTSTIAAACFNTKSEKSLWILDVSNPSTDQPVCLAKETYHAKVTSVALSHRAARESRQIECLVGLDDGGIVLHTVDSVSPLSRQYAISREVFPKVGQTAEGTGGARSSSASAGSGDVQHRDEAGELEREHLKYNPESKNFKTRFVSRGCLCGNEKLKENEKKALQEFPNMPTRLSANAVTSLTWNPGHPDLFVCATGAGFILEFNLRFGRSCPESENLLCPVEKSSDDRVGPAWGKPPQQPSWEQEKEKTVPESSRRGLTVDAVPASGCSPMTKRERDKRKPQQQQQEGGGSQDFGEGGSPSPATTFARGAFYSQTVDAGGDSGFRWCRAGAPVTPPNASMTLEEYASLPPNKLPGVLVRGPKEKAVETIDTHSRQVARCQADFAPLRPDAPGNPIGRWNVVEAKSQGRVSLCCPIPSLEFSPDGALLAAATAGRRGECLVFAYPSGSLCLSVRSFFGAPLCLCFSNDSRLLCIGGEDDAVTVVDLLSRCVAARLLGHSSWVRSVRPVAPLGEPQMPPPCRTSATLLVWDGRQEKEGEEGNEERREKKREREEGAQGGSGKEKEGVAWASKVCKANPEWLGWYRDFLGPHPVSSSSDMNMPPMGGGSVASGGVSPSQHPLSSGGQTATHLSVSRHGGAPAAAAGGWPSLSRDEGRSVSESEVKAAQDEDKGSLILT
uniref:Minichromosome loss protein Mcl1 middle region domain-containing protein n=1 Tax=Chromera velia CCMP2878 TaxID=1169474 RepID=A0A0G4HH83_9ALVE|eukprot:Cvel_27573.t1-p1 / transcript=Cvel_27573.t1 / gene=Cvel_27573 / organism=Chromera_velia_CCMP2878 / gene_product=Dystrophia myotonica WD repeat-containing protein, putative / transcript_product=Dystrophia myotonica WD repeat-containing protein, putative / location=Cvel_scaffold3465:11093-14020(-) / protein_length=743 / sequence_SO=supercontig / SO=protein_coding / is_pseudo=false